MNKFWNSSSGTYKLDPESLHKFLDERGFRTYQPAGVKTKVLVKSEDKRVREVSHLDIWRLCWDYINTEFEFTDPDERRKVKDIFHRSKALFNQQNLLLLPEVDQQECQDTKGKSYLFFRDCALEIRSDSVSIKEYNEIEGVVWETDISDFILKPLLPPEKDSLDAITPEGEFYEFIKDLCKNENKVVNEKSLESLTTIIGYLTHRYKDPANAKAIIYMDTYKDGSPNGGTGKGLLTKGICKVRESTFLDGKFFSSKDKFTFANTEYGTRIIVIDDVPKNFDLERIFPLITEKATVERKYEDKFVIPFEESPKVIITSNYTIEGTSSSHKRRKVEFILSETYNAEYTPEDKFGHLLYIDWNENEWHKFYLVITYCIQQFLSKGIVEPMINVAVRKLKMEASQRFIEYVHQNVEPGKKLNKKTVYFDFYTKNADQKTIELTTFRNWLKYFADAYGFKFNESHSGNDNFFEFTC